MNAEDFVSFEQAKTLKQLGFDLLTNFVYTNCNYDIYDRNVEPINEGELISTQSKYYVKGNCIYAPTLSQTQKWLRDVKEIHIEIRYVINPQYEPWIGKVITLKDYYQRYNVIETDTCDTYEEALSEGIDIALGLLEKNN